jgi:outer membrane protein assembly factor BamB
VVRVSRDGVVVGSFAVPGTGSPLFGVHGAPLEDDARTLYFGAQDDAVRAVDATGAELFRFATGGDVDGPLTMLADGTLVFASEDGRVYALAP